MATRLDKYRMADGRTPLSADYFNPVWADLDARLDDLERRRADFDQAIRDLTAFGLERIDTLIGPAMDDLNSKLIAVQKSYDELVAAIAALPDIPAQMQSLQSQVDQRLGVVESLVFAAL